MTGRARRQTIHHSPFTIHHSPFTIHHSPFTIHHSPFTGRRHLRGQAGPSWSSCRRRPPRWRFW
ncbi:hypothetical protein DPM33_06155 [Mesorhizobium hawassense]|uniref:Uncharacterized protein n=1 Tax=Mesorhizobium hawassense TaxID=1209954 RepID=A0A330HZ76_9HYPH|nr:hypothetical protein DPM33_06155 [Mesorhizobium hawassense]